MKSLISIACMIVAFATLALSGVAHADVQSKPLTFCNKTSNPVGVAYGYFTPGANDPADHSVLTGPFVSLGWRTLSPGQCGTFENPFNARYVFWYGVSRNYNTDVFTLMYMRDPQKPPVGPEPVHFCVTNYHNASSDDITPSFTYEDENLSRDNCDRTGGANTVGGSHTLWVIPKKVDTWVDAVVNFTGDTGSPYSN